ncbi:MAG: hypothetical protein ACOYKZ_02910 [Chlamydiia bacterium]
MNAGRFAGLIAIVVGVVAIGYAIHSHSRIAEAELKVKNVATQTANATSNTLSSIFQPSKYETQTTLLLFGGIALIVIGGGVAFFTRGRR